jgi:hypothetical protein
MKNDDTKFIKNPHQQTNIFSVTILQQVAGESLHK